MSTCFLPKFTMFGTYYTNLCFTIYIIYFGIIVFITMNFFSFFNKRVSIIFIFANFIFFTFWASLSTSMSRRNLPEFSMNGTNYTNFSFTVYIFYFWIIVFVTVNRFCFFYKTFCCYFFPYTVLSTTKIASITL